MSQSMIATRLARPVSRAQRAATQAELKKQKPSARWPSLSSCPAWCPGGRMSANAASHDGRATTPFDVWLLLPPPLERVAWGAASSTAYVASMTQPEARRAA
jgi:hypothetical protein